MRASKLVDQLTIDDLERTPIWRFDDDNDDQASEDTVIPNPRKHGEPVNATEDMFVVRSRFVLADGTQFLGYLNVPVGAATIESIRPVVVTEHGQVPFWYGVNSPTDDELVDCYARLQRRGSAVFPIRYASDTGLVSDQRTGTITAFMHYRSYSDRRKAQTRMTASARQVVTTGFAIALEDASWQALGFSKRPKYGRVLQGFRPFGKLRWKNHSSRR